MDTRPARQDAVIESTMYDTMQRTHKHFTPGGSATSAAHSSSEGHVHTSSMTRKPPPQILTNLLYAHLQSLITLFFLMVVIQIIVRQQHRRRRCARHAGQLESMESMLNIHQPHCMPSLLFVTLVSEVCWAVQLQCPMPEYADSPGAVTIRTWSPSPQTHFPSVS